MKKEVKNEKFAFCTNKEVKNGKYTFCDHEYWYKDNRLHREDGPAVTLKDGSKGWYLEGTYHREDGPAIEYADGHCEWWFEGKKHRIDGPAVLIPSASMWYMDDMKHREDGPAIETSDGFFKYYLFDVEMTEEDYFHEVGKLKLKKTLESSLHQKHIEKRAKL